jgi:hypothetical protein
LATKFAGGGQFRCLIISCVVRSETQNRLRKQAGNLVVILINTNTYIDVAN